jgi:hypothetical protein
MTTVQVRSADEIRLTSWLAPRPAASAERSASTREYGDHDRGQRVAQDDVVDDIRDQAGGGVRSAGRLDRFR